MNSMNEIPRHVGKPHPLKRIQEASFFPTNSMRVFILSLLALAAAHASAPAAWGGAHVTTLGKVDASSGSNLALRGGFVDTIKNMVSLASFPARDATNVVVQANSLCRRHHPCTLHSCTDAHFLYNAPGDNWSKCSSHGRKQLSRDVLCGLGCIVYMVFNIDAGKK